MNVSDGGADAAVHAVLGGPLGVTAPSCWQFKATLSTAIDEPGLPKEANKSEAKRLIEAGYAYYTCVCDDVPPNRLAALDAAILKIVREINDGAPPPRVFGAGHLASWTDRHPGIVVRFFRQSLGIALTYDQWLRKERALLPEFVDLPIRAPAVEAIRRHVAGGKPGRAPLTVGGPAGAGVSRLLAESLASVAERVVYVPEGTDGVQITTSLVNRPTATGIIVLERCGARVREDLGSILRGTEGRLRAVVTQDAAEEASDVAPKLTTLGPAEVQRVIDANFASVNGVHRRAFVHLADGSLKIAAALRGATGLRPQGARGLPRLRFALSRVRTVAMRGVPRESPRCIQL